MLVQSFDTLNKKDKQEILNLIEFKRMMKEKCNDFQ